jgi:hypothetical protein
MDNHQRSCQVCHNCLGIIEVGNPISIQSQAQSEGHKKKGKRKMQGSNHIVHEVRLIWKPRQPNRENHDVVALVEAKRWTHKFIGHGEFQG